MYDSMGYTDLPQDVKQQIAALILIPTNITLIFQSNNKILTLHLKHIFAFQQIQADDQACLRHYLTKCFMSETMEPFPARQRKAQRSYNQVKYDVYCSCRRMRGDDKMAKM